MRRLMCSGLLALMGWACSSDGEPEPVAPAPSCTPDVDCPVAPFCGDGEVDPAEGCDDGNELGGDGCRPDCTLEEGVLEVEPNDDPSMPQTVAGEMLHGTLSAGDRDCFAVEVAEAGFVDAMVVPDGVAGDRLPFCTAELVLELYDDGGTRIASGLPDDRGCASVADDTFAWYLPAGDYGVCVVGAFGATSPAYTLTLRAGDSCSGDAPPPDRGQDLDGDGEADVCDDDDDDDGVLDAIDNCPQAPNGPLTPIPWDTSDDGFVRLWMLLGPYAGTTPGQCEPSVESFAGPDDAQVAPSLGDAFGGTPWVADFSWPQDPARIAFTDSFGPPAPREAYAATWIFAPEARSAELAIGVDDGIRVWLNGTVVGTNAGCQGVSTDQFRYPVNLAAGFNRLVTKVYDGGGAWGQIVRVYAADGITPMADLGVSLTDAPWVDDQTDSDNDGIGDICDPDPTAP